MTAPEECAADLARACREALNQEIYGGGAPHDSNALSEVWPTAAGAAFTIQRHGRTYGVVVAPAEDMTALIRPGWGEWPGLQHPRSECEVPGVCKFHPGGRRG